MNAIASQVNRLATVDSGSLLLRYYDLIRNSSDSYDLTGDPQVFEPSKRLPDLDKRVEAFLEPATASYVDVGTYRGVPIHVLDLRQNRGTQTTKTLASSLIILRAVNHVMQTGENVLLFSPSSGNKATALRDAVARAIQSGLVGEEQLRIATLTPEETLFKMRASLLTMSDDVARRNPMFILRGGPGERVKAVGSEITRRYNGSGNTRLWNSLKPDNYRFADQARAFFDHEFGHSKHPDKRFVHVHAVSSAYGLLGYQSGIDVLRLHGFDTRQPGYLLVQHLATCDMVLHLDHGSFDKTNIPEYNRGSDGLWTQSERINFPKTTYSPTEVLEKTFYTHEPTTSHEMSQLIHNHGGGGIVVSLVECLGRYGEAYDLLAKANISIPEDPRLLNEWSVVMAITGTLNAIDRGMLDGFDAVTIHASGVYAAGDYAPVPLERTMLVHSADEVLAQL
jgi:hypothetical protein